MIVEDDAGLNQGLCKALNAENRQLISCRDLKAAREQLEISIAQEEMQKPMLTKEQVILWISRFKNGNVNDMAFRQRLIDTFVNAIYLYDDRIVLTYNYKDGSHTVTLAQVEETFGRGDNSSSDLGEGAPIKKLRLSIWRN